MVKTSSFVWKYFIKIRKDGCKYLKGKCIFCGTEYTTNAKRMVNHLLGSCKLCPKDVRFMIQSGCAGDDLFGRKPLNLKSLMPAASVSGGDGTTTKKKRGRKPVVVQRKGWYDPKSDCDKEKLDQLLARSFYSNAATLQLIESCYFRTFIKYIRPAYDPPTRKTLAGSLLNKEYKLMQNLVQHEVALADSLTVMSYGWTDAKGASLVNIIVATPKPVFYESVHTDDNNPHEAEYIAQVISNSIDKLGPRKVQAVVTDKAANMKNAWVIIRQKYPHVVTFGCCTHGLNVFVKNILSIKSVSSVMNDAKEIIKCFKNRQVCRKVLLEAQKESPFKGRSLLTMVEARCFSVVMSLERLLEAKECLQTAVADARLATVLNSHLKKCVGDEDFFWVSINNIYNLLKPVTDLIKFLEGDSPKIAHIYPELRKLDKSLEENVLFMGEQDRNAVVLFCEDRNAFICHRIHLAATQLHPLLKEKLGESEQTEAFNFIMWLADKLELDRKQVTSEIADYKSKGGLWKEKSIWEAAEVCDEVTWWKAFCSQREISKIAVRILSTPVTAASCGRHGATFPNVRAKQRNRLTASRINKLVYIKHNLNLFENVNLDDKVKELCLKDKEQPGNENLPEECSMLFDEENDYNDDGGSDSGMSEILNYDTFSEQPTKQEELLSAHENNESSFVDQCYANGNFGEFEEVVLVVQK